LLDLYSIKKSFRGDYYIVFNQLTQEKFTKAPPS